jgi:hypothetical protein
LVNSAGLGTADGIVVVTLKLALVVPVPAAIGVVSVTVQSSSPPATFRLVQLTPPAAMFVNPITAVAVTPIGS